MSIEIALTAAEWLYAGTRGLQRQIDAALRCREPGHYASMEKRPSDGWWWNINGASGEQCVAKWLGVPWDGAFGDLDAADVGGVLQVRTTPGHDYPLRLHEEDPDDAVYLLVTGIGPTWRIQGFIRGVKGKRPEWYHDRPPPAKKSTGRPAFWVPQEALHRDLDILRDRFWRRYGGAA